jgi:two-component system, LytTR family, sensor kinase
MLGVMYRNNAQMEARIEDGFKIAFLFAILPSVISFYLFYFLLFPKYIQQKKIILSVVYGLLISVCSAVVGYGILTSTYGKDCGLEDTDTSSTEVILFISFVALVAGIIALVIQGFITWFEEIKLKDDLKQKNQEMELALVKSQLDPHFLFNTLNNIDILILKDPTEASNYLNKLSDIMRFILYETKTDKILLSKEIQYIEKYIELQKIRTSNLNYVSLLVTGGPGNRTIAPMIFIPFIENAFKHTTNKKWDSAITINILIKDETILFECDNKYDPNRKAQQADNGLGNALIQKRLSLIYPENHILEIVDQNDLYSVRLTIING